MSAITDTRTPGHFNGTYLKMMAQLEREDTPEESTCMMKENWERERVCVCVREREREESREQE